MQEDKRPFPVGWLIACIILALAITAVGLYYVGHASGQPTESLGAGGYIVYNRHKITDAKGEEVKVYFHLAPEASPQDQDFFFAFDEVMITTTVVVPKSQYDRLVVKQKGLTWKSLVLELREAPEKPQP